VPAEVCDLVRGLPTGLTQRAEEIIRHIRDDLVVHGATPIDIRPQKPLDLLGQGATREKQLHHRAHIGTAMCREHRGQSSTRIAASPPPARTLRTNLAAHARQLSPPTRRRKRPVLVAPTARET
jgi:hypothetical protein